MNETSNIVPLRQPDEIDDPLTSARQLLAQAVEVEVETFLATVKDADGRVLLGQRSGPASALTRGA
jgi:hypothetical protein